MKTILSVTLLLCLALIMPLSAFGKPRKLPPVVARFGGECSGTALRHSPHVQQLIKAAREREVSPCNSPSCDGAFAFDLSGDGRSEYFVRLGCGATGNCKWGIFSDRPARIRGTFIAWFFYIHRRSGSWSQLSTYKREGGDRGVIGTLANRRGKYIQTSERTEQGDHRDPQPFLTRMGTPKCEVSGTAPSSGRKEWDLVRVSSCASCDSWISFLGSTRTIHEKHKTEEVTRNVLNSSFEAKAGPR